MFNEARRPSIHDQQRELTRRRELTEQLRLQRIQQMPSEGNDQARRWYEQQCQQEK